MSVQKRIKDSQAQENRVMEELGGKRTGGSGSVWNRKGDGRVDGEHWTALDHVLVENKRTDKKSYSIKSSELEKLFDEAAMEGRIPLMGIELNGRDYILMEQVDYIEMRDQAIGRTTGEGDG